MNEFFLTFITILLGNVFWVVLKIEISFFLGIFSVSLYLHEKIVLSAARPTVSLTFDACAA